MAPTHHFHSLLQRKSIKIKEVKKQIKTHKDTSLSLYPLKSLKKSYAVLN